MHKLFLMVVMAFFCRNGVISLFAPRMATQDAFCS